MPSRFTGKVAVVTGAASGIGRGIVERLAREGANVLLADLDAGGESAARGLREAGLIASFFQVDVTDAEACRRMVEAAVGAWGRLDILVNSAGIGAGEIIAKCDEATWDRVMETNLKGTFLSCRAALASMTQGGTILNIASLAGLMAAPGFGPYAASKAGVIQLTRVLALEAAPLQIRANAICPVWVDTPMLRAHLAQARRPDRARRELEARIPLRRLATVDDVAAAALFLASDEAAFITGIAFPVDGGVSCH